MASISTRNPHWASILFFASKGMLDSGRRYSGDAWPLPPIGDPCVSRHPLSGNGRHCPDGGVPDPAMMGFRRGFQCAEVVSVLRGLVE